MYLIAGLGNPGTKYDKTRHNTGFRVIDILAEQYHISVMERAHKAILGKGYIDGEKVILAKPQTFMNLSGESIREILAYYKINPVLELIVIADDISLVPGQLRIRKQGSAGGHNGLKSIIAETGTEKFIRVKIGVGEKPEHYDLADYVLGTFSKTEESIMKLSCEAGAKAIAAIVAEGVDSAMNRYNGFRAETE